MRCSPHAIPTARASIEVLDASGRIVRAWEGPPEVVRKDFRRLLLRTTLFRTGNDLTHAWADTGNTSRTVRAVSQGGNPYPWNASLAASATACKFDVGSSATAPTADDVAIGTQLGTTFNATSTTRDTGLFQTVIRGSLQNNSGSTWTVREVLQRLVAEDTTPAAREWSVDHSSVSPNLTVENGQTVNVKYTWST
jgi:hypothetical protein